MWLVILIGAPVLIAVLFAGGIISQTRLSSFEKEMQRRAKERLYSNSNEN